VSPPRQLDLHGAVSGCDAAGRCFELRCEGALITVDSQSTRAALAALSALQGARAGGALAVLSPLAPWAAGQLEAFRVEFRVRGRLVGRAGQGARPNWLGRRIAQWPIEMHLGALLLAALLAY
jgi:hypothetical protein